MSQPSQNFLHARLIKLPGIRTLMGWVLALLCTWCDIPFTPMSSAQSDKTASWHRWPNRYRLFCPFFGRHLLYTYVFRIWKKYFIVQPSTR